MLTVPGIKWEQQRWGFESTMTWSSRSGSAHCHAFPCGNFSWVECVGCDQVVDHEHCVQKLWVWALTLILKQNPDQQEIHNQAKHNETWVSWKRLHWNNIHSLVIFTDNLCSAQLGLSMWRFVFLVLAMQPRNSWAQGILLTCPPKQVGLQVHNATTSNVMYGADELS